MMDRQIDRPGPFQTGTRLRARPARSWKTARPPVLIVPGIRGSGPAHWQSHWQRAVAGAERLEQSDWDRPRLSDWTAALAEALRRRPGAVVVAHSLGCALVAHYARISGGRNIGAALLVAPADVDRAAPWLGRQHTFGPMPDERLGFPTLVVASRDDPYVSLGRARGFADRWDADFHDLGHAGHINVDSGHGPWPEGLPLLDGLVERLAARSAPTKG